MPDEIEAIHAEVIVWSKNQRFVHYVGGGSWRQWGCALKVLPIKAALIGMRFTPGSKKTAWFVRRGELSTASQNLDFWQNRRI